MRTHSEVEFLDIVVRVEAADLIGDKRIAFGFELGPLRNSLRVEVRKADCEFDYRHCVGTLVEYDDVWALRAFLRVLHMWEMAFDSSRINKDQGCAVVAGAAQLIAESIKYDIMALRIHRQQRAAVVQQLFEVADHGCPSFVGASVWTVHSSDFANWKPLVPSAEVRRRWQSVKACTIGESVDISENSSRVGQKSTADSVGC